MKLVIDFGNTIAKAAVFDNSEIVKLIKSTNLEEIIHLTREYQIDDCIISSTSIEPQHIQDSLPIKSRILSYKMSYPFKINYETPNTMGLDRIAVVAGAFDLFSGDDSLVIDCGSCITYDLLVSQEFIGGAISPGVNMRFKALNTFTANLPLVELSEMNSLVGTSTDGSLRSGVFNGIRAELDEMITSFSEEYGPLKVVICGGDYIFFENKLKASIFAAPELVLKGLNGILRYNA